MPCFGNSEDKRFDFPSICIHCPFPTNPDKYLPKLTEHRIQTEPHDVIDDPSSIFFDPNEKSGFVYSHVPSVIIDYDKQFVLTLPESKTEQIKVATSKVTTTKDNSKERERHLSLSSEFADSLDRTPSLSASPLHGDDSYRYNEHFRQASRQDSLEFDPIVDGPICQVTLNNKDFCRPPTTADGLSEDDVRKLYENSHEPFFIDDFNDLHIYEEDILNDIAKSNGNKGYLSDAESVKTYQDSGIYDDDVIIESPGRVKQSSKDDVFNDVDGELQIEKYSAFKTPLSSRHNSLEYLALESSPLEMLKSLTHKSGGEERNEAMSELDSLDMIENMLDLELNEKKKRNDKYSHIQAKVQCFRTKAERSVSPRNSIRRKSADSVRTGVKKTPPSSSIKPKVDSMSNVKYVPGGGTNKVFKEKLKFKRNAQPRTDTHGIEMYAHLPTEFQEIARRLARQDNQLKEQTTRGRGLTRSKSSVGRSGASPKRGRSRTKKTKSCSEETQKKKLNLESLPIGKPASLSRSSSIRSVPSAPKISQRHPSSSKINRTPSTTSQSPSAHTPNGNHSDSKSKPNGNHSDGKVKSKQRDSSKGKENKGKENVSKVKDKERTSKEENKMNSMKGESAAPSTNVSSLCQYISENESFGAKKMVCDEDTTQQEAAPLAPLVYDRSWVDPT